ncbi:MAG TPA: hypothetical protein VGK61_05700 [Planctomycetota bacterium]|jgi:tetratricopeptide (TPR) repeat protein
MRTAAILAVLLVSAAPQDKAQEDVIQMKSEGKLYVGRVTAINDKSIEMTLRDGSQKSLDLKDVHPLSVYKLREARIDAKSGAAHFELAEFCKSNGLFGYAVGEYDKAAVLDAGLKEKARRAKESLRSEEARTKFEQAKRLGAEKKYGEALELLKQLTERFTDTPYFEEARKEADKLAEELKKENEARRAEIEEKKRKKEEEAAKVVENAEKADLKRGQDLIGEARTSWEEGLDWEAKGNLTKADKAWKASDARLASAHVLVEKLEKSNDVNTIKSAKDLQKEVDTWTVRICYRLGRLWATELNYFEALPWFNRGIKLDPDNHLLNDVLLTLTQLQMRKRAAGGGY